MADCSVLLPFASSGSNLCAVYLELKGGGNALGVVIGAVIAVIAYLLKAIVTFVVRKAEEARVKRELLTAIEREVLDTIKNYEGYLDYTFTKSIMRDIFRTPDYLPYSPVVRMVFSPDDIKERTSLLSGKFQQGLMAYYYSDCYCDCILKDFGQPQSTNRQHCAD